MNSQVIKEIHSKRLDELIYDEEKIVTLFSIAKDLNISMVDAKILLNGYVKNQIHSKVKDLKITYIVSGVIKDNGTFAVYLLKAEDLDVKRASFKIVESEVVYSLQKGQQIDFNIIASFNEDLCYNGNVLTSKNCVKRNVASFNQAASGCSKSTQANVSTKFKDAQHQHQNEDNIKQAATEVTDKLIKPKQNGGITSFFNKVSIKKEIQNTSDSKVKTSTEEKMNLFTISAEKNNDAIKESKVKMEIDVDEEKSPKKIIFEDVNDKKRKKKIKNSAPSKKRKRIQEICDSDSSDIFDDVENGDIIEKSDEELPPIVTKAPSPAPKNKIRKAIDKTYVDDEGFVVTSTEYVYESMSEEEQQILKESSSNDTVLAEKKSTNNVAPNAIGGPKRKTNKKQTNSKQSTLMSFFKKN